MRIQKMRMISAMMSLLAAICMTDVQAGQFVVIGVDRTEDYGQMTKTAIAIAADYIDQAKPGDHILVRWISDASYPPDQIITDLSLPSVELPEVKGIYDRKGKRQRQLMIVNLKHQIFRLKLQVIDLLHNQCVGSTKGTDIIGFLTAAAEHFANASPHDEKLLVLATDLGENRNYKAKINLQETDVQIYLIQSVADPAQVEATRTRWIALFEDWSASNIDFRWPTYQQINWNNEKCIR